METSQNSKSIFSLKQPLLRLCESLLLLSFSLPVWLQLPSVAVMNSTWMKLTNLVRLGLKIGLTASRAYLSNARLIVGGIMLVLTVCAYFFHYLFDETVDDRSWYYTSWFHFFENMQPYSVALFGTLAAFFHWPSKSKTAYIVFTVLHTLPWLKVIHFSLFTYDYDSYHAKVTWPLAAISFAFAIGFVLASHHLVYVFEHKIKGNHKRFVGLAEMQGVDPELKDRMLKDNANEYRRLYTHY